RAAPAVGFSSGCPLLPPDSRATGSRVRLVRFPPGGVRREHGREESRRPVRRAGGGGFPARVRHGGSARAGACPPPARGFRSAAARPRQGVPADFLGHLCRALPDGDAAARLFRGEGRRPASAGRAHGADTGSPRAVWGGSRRAHPGGDSGGPPGLAFENEAGMTKTPTSIVILDFGGQYTQLIARRIREARVFSVVLPPDAPAEEIRRWNPAGIILSGGPQSV